MPTATDRVHVSRRRAHVQFYNIMHLRFYRVLTSKKKKILIINLNIVYKTTTSIVFQRVAA